MEMKGKGDMWRLWRVFHRIGNDIMEQLCNFMLMDLEIYLRVGKIGDKVEMVVFCHLKRMNEE